MNKLIEIIKNEKICAILRGIPSDKMESVITALYRGGIRLLEITFNQNSKTKYTDTCSAIKLAKSLFPDLHVGAGTAMYKEDVIAAHEAGAEFVLAPNFNREVVMSGASLGILVIAGAMTPSEIAEAYECGSEIVKLFPAGNLGTSYIKAITAPMNHIPLMAVGGIDLHNLKDYLNVGCCSIGIGSCLTDKKMIADNDWDALTKLAEKYVEAAK